MSEKELNADVPKFSKLGSIVETPTAVPLVAEKPGLDIENLARSKSIEFEAIKIP